MVPAFLEQVDAIPMTLSNKADYKRLPKPQQLQRVSATQRYVPPKTDRERMLHAALTGVIRAEHVSTEAHFFDDLGANSLLMARVCAAIRKNPGMSNVSMRDIYMHPTIARLAHHLDSSSIDSSVVATKPEPFHVPSTLSYVTCGVLQIGFLAAYLLFDLWILWSGFLWAFASDSVVDLYVRGVAFGGGLFVVLFALPIAAKWLLIGRLQGTIDSYLELCIFPLLGCQDPYAHIACGCLHRHTALQRLSAPYGRQDRPQCDHHGPSSGLY